jgi:hypothetical protein
MAEMSNTKDMAYAEQQHVRRVWRAIEDELYLLGDIDMRYGLKELRDIDGLRIARAALTAASVS